MSYIATLLAEAVTECPVSAHYVNTEGEAHYLLIETGQPDMPSTGEMVLMASLNMHLRTRGLR
jgi:hypothetical protein